VRLGPSQKPLKAKFESSVLIDDMSTLEEAFGD